MTHALARYRIEQDHRVDPARAAREHPCLDNAAAESFFATLKNEMYYRRTFGTRSVPSTMSAAAA